MVETGRGGSIIHMSSQMGHVGGARRTLYCASKWAVEGLSKAMALDIAPHKIRVNTIAPTFIEHAMTAPSFQDETFNHQMLRTIQLVRLRPVGEQTGAILTTAVPESIQ